MQKELHQLVNNFQEVFKAIHQKSYHKLEDKCLYPGQPKLLVLIKSHEGIPQKDLSEKTFVKPASITGMLNKLEANHYVYRVPDQEDKRIMRVYLTPEGRIFADQAEKFLKKMTMLMFDGFTAEEIQTMLAYTERMKKNLQTYEK